MFAGRDNYDKQVMPLLDWPAADISRLTIPTANPKKRLAFISHTPLFRFSRVMLLDDGEGGLVPPKINCR